MPPLRRRQDAAVENGAVRAEDAVQCVRGEVQVGAAGAGISAGGEPHVCADEAFEFAQEGSRAEEEEGDAAAISASSTSNHDF